MKKERRSFDRKRRGIETRLRKPILLLQVEGRNKTEKNYFEYFQSGNSKYRIIVTDSGDTDPKNMQKAIKKKYKSYEMNSDNGDLAYVVLDLDCSENKAKMIREETNGFPFIVSNPCIEVWFLNHFQYSTKEYISSDKVIDALRICVPHYEKNMNIYPILADKIETACANERKLRNHFVGRPWPSSECNPRSDVLDLIPKLQETSITQG